MISLDTNVIARAVLNDHQQQSPIAVAMLTEKSLIVPTVMVELVWVLGSAAKWSRREIVATLHDLLDIASLTIVEREAIEWATARYAAGADFADMLHLALTGEATAFVTFDEELARHADHSVVAVETLA